MPNNNFKIAKDIVSSYENRIKVVQAIVKDTAELLEKFRKRREEMSGQLKEALAKRESLRKKDFDKMMEDILVAQKTREENVKQMLLNFQEGEMAVVNNLRGMLSKGTNLKLKDFKITLAKIRNEQENKEKESSSKIQVELVQMQSEVKEMLEDFKKKRQKVASEWREMVGEMKNKRSKQTNK